MTDSLDPNKTFSQLSAERSEQPEDRDGLFPKVPTSISMLDGLRAGDPAAWERFVRIFGPMIYRILRKDLNEEDARDVGQDVLLKVDDQLKNFVRDGKKLKLRYWLPSVIRSVFIDFVRKKNKQIDPVGGSVFHALIERAPENWDQQIGIDHFELTDDDDSIAIQAALQELQPTFQPKNWRAFYAITIQQRPSKDVAAELEMTDGAVRQAANRIKNRLKVVLQEFVDIDS
jgi:RNA polymerase sigma-70 factor (ECF subfamily)